MPSATRMTRASQKSTNDAAAMATAPLAPHAAFVVHLRAGTPVTATEIYGRVEHVASGAATAFRSLEEVRAFMDRVLAAHTAAPSPLEEEFAVDETT